MYSCGQPKSPNSVSQQGVNLGVRFFRILTQIVEMCRKTHLRSFFPRCFSVAKILGLKTAIFCHGKPGLGGGIYT